MNLSGPNQKRARRFKNQVRKRLYTALQLSALETNSDGRAEDVRFRTIPTPTPTGGGYVGGMVAQGVSKDCIFNEDFRYVLKFAVGAVVYELG